MQAAHHHPFREELAVAAASSEPTPEPTTRNGHTRERHDLEKSLAVLRCPAPRNMPPPLRSRRTSKTTTTGRMLYTLRAPGSHR
jgi:hypothetical protein